MRGPSGYPNSKGKWSWASWKPLVLNGRDIRPVHTHRTLGNGLNGLNDDTAGVSFIAGAVLDTPLVGVREDIHSRAIVGPSLISLLVQT